MTVTPIDGGHQIAVQSLYYDFPSEEEAQMFVQWAREDLDEHEEFFDYVGHDVDERNWDYGNAWVARIDYIDRTPREPEAA
jgi:hypothetical protein